MEMEKHDSFLNRAIAAMHFITNNLTSAVFMGFLIRIGLARAEHSTHIASLGMSQSTGDKGKYFQFANAPTRGAYKFGFNRGNAEHSISRHEQSRGGSFRSKVKWNDNKGSSGEQYWEYNHEDKGGDGWNNGYSQSHRGNGYSGAPNDHRQWANLPKGMDEYTFKGFSSYPPSAAGYKTSEEVPSWAKGFVNTGYPSWEDASNKKPWTNMYSQDVFAGQGGGNFHFVPSAVPNYGGEGYAASTVDAVPGFPYHSVDPYQSPGPSYSTASLPYPGNPGYSGYPGGSPAGTQVRGEMYHQISGTLPSSPETFKENHFRGEASGDRPYAFDNPMMSYEQGGQGNGVRYGEGNPDQSGQSLDEMAYGNAGNQGTSGDSSGYLGAGSMTEVVFTSNSKRNQTLGNDEQKFDGNFHNYSQRNETKKARSRRIHYARKVNAGLERD